MKKLYILLPILLLFFLLALACGPTEGPGVVVQVPVTAAPTSTPEPTPTPPPQVLLMGTEGDAAAIGQSAGEFLSVFDTRETLLAAERGPGRVLVICLDREALTREDIDALQTGSDALIFLDTGDAAEDSPYAIKAEPIAPPEELPQALLDSLLAFTLHEVPVRLFGLFESKESAAYAAYDKRLGEGKLFNRGRYVIGVDTKPIAEWISDACEKYIQGTLDGIFCENDEIAALCVRKLADLGRTNVEVYSAAPGELYLALQAEYPKIAVCSLGYTEHFDVYAYINECIAEFVSDAPLPQEAPTITQNFVYSVASTL